MGHTVRELQRVVHLEQSVPVIGHEDDTATPYRVESLSPAEHAEDDLVDGRTRTQEQPGLGGTDRHLHQGFTFGHEA